MATKAKNATAKTVETVVEASKEQFEQAVKVGTETASKNFEKGFEFARKQIDEAVKSFDEVASFSKENVEAVIASTNAATKGFEALNAEFAALSKKNFEDGIAAVKALSAAKNVREYVDLQNSLVKDSYDAFVAESSRLSEMALKVAGEVLQPVSTRVSVAADKFAHVAAR